MCRSNENFALAQNSGYQLTMLVIKLLRRNNLIVHQFSYFDDILLAIILVNNRVTLFPHTWCSKDIP